MKKVLFYIGCALFVASMTVACNNKKNTEPVDSTTCCEAVEEIATETECTAAPVEAAATMSEAEHAAMLDAAREAGRAKCNCYKTDPSSVEACIKSILSETYASYQNNDEFKATMEAEFNSCVKEKVSDAAKDAAEKGIKAGADALSKKLNGGK
ncbi:MAG: hypothetical protein IJ789_02510 [Bacteroidales bacterium]|nr:hypothetical protein [Bacteroidales bacterium]